MLPSHLIVEFWDAVNQELRNRHQLSEVEVTKAVFVYRSALERHRIGDLVYHRDPESVAETIARGRESGFPDPPPLETES